MVIISVAELRDKTKKPATKAGFRCRVDWIRTSDPLHPIQVRYRAAPPPEVTGLHTIPESGGCKFNGIKLTIRFPALVCTNYDK